MQAYISLTDVVENTELKLQLVSLSDNRILIATGIPLSPTNRLSTVQLVVPLPQLPLQVQECMHSRLFAMTRFVGSHRIDVVRGIRPVLEVE